MKEWIFISVLSLVLAITWGGEGSAQTKKEMTISGTHYWSTAPKIFPLDPDRSISHRENFGIFVNDNVDGLFHRASTFSVGVSYRGKGYNGNRAYYTLTDKDGDKLIWELMDIPAGASSYPGRLIEGTGKYMGWKGTMEYTMQIPGSFPEGTIRGICRDVMKLTAP